MSFFIIALAVARISILLVKEDGPFDVFLKIRERAGVIVMLNTADGSTITYGDNVFSQILSCVWCASIYVGFLFAALFYLNPVWAELISLPFALSMAAILVDNYLDQRV